MKQSSHRTECDIYNLYIKPEETKNGPLMKVVARRNGPEKSESETRFAGNMDRYSAVETNTEIFKFCDIR